MRVGTLSAAILLSALIFCPSGLHAAPAGWKLYRNAPTGLSFWYPPSLQVREEETRRGGLADVDANVDLSDGHDNVMRFTVWHDSVSAIQSVDRACKPIRLGGQEAAFNCVNCLPACFWGIEIVSPRLCTMGPTAPSDTLQLEIAKTVHFEGPATASQTPVETKVQATASPSGTMRDAGIFVTNYNTIKPKQFRSNTITTYVLNSGGNEQPVTLIRLLDYARGIAVDSRGYIYAANEGLYGSGGNVKVFPPDSGIDTGPIATRSFGGTYFPVGIALDARGDMYVVSDNGTVNPGGKNADSVNVYPPGSHGDARPGATISGR